MSLPVFSTQAELFSTARLSGSLFAPTDRYRLFGSLIYPRLAAARAQLEKCYCSDNGRTAIEPVLLLGVSILQDIDGVPDRQAVEMLRYHALAYDWIYDALTVEQRTQFGDALTQKLFIAPATVAIGDRWLVRFNPTGPIGGRVGDKPLAATIDTAAQCPVKPRPGR